MNLEKKSRLETGHSPVDAHHGQLDQIGRRALNRGIDGGSFGEATGVGIAAVHVGNGPLAAEERAGNAGFAGLGDGVVDESLHCRSSARNRP